MELITEDDLRACRLNLSKGPRAVSEGANPSTTAILPASNVPYETNAGLRGGFHHDFLFVVSISFCFAHLLISVY